MSKFIKGLKLLGNPNKLVVVLSEYKIGKLFSDKFYLKSLYKYRTGKKLNLKNPKGFNAKLQWIKLYDRNPLYTTMVDKYEVKKYIAEKIGEQYVIPNLGVWDKFEDIDFSSLPNQFVLKCTHDSGGLIICRDKSKLDIEKARANITSSLKSNYYYSSREWPYKNVKPRIIAEAYMDDFQPGEEGYGGGLTDYKFFCFNGEPKMLYISRGLENHKTAQISFYDLECNRMPFKRTDFAGIKGDIKKPQTIDEMIKIAEKLAKEVGCAFSRVDLYEINGKVYFSEFTFFPCSGLIPFDPPEWDEKIGEWVDLGIK